MIALTPVDGSSQIAAHGYHSPTQTLAVRFKSGGVYHYRDVPPDVAAKFSSAKSLGSHLHQHIKGKYPHEMQTEDSK